jgi:hypothetical protein
MPRFPQTFAAWLLTVLGSLLLLFAFVLHWGMYVVVFGHKTVSPGGGEFAVALFGGVPTALLSSACLGTASLRTAWRSTASVMAIGAAGALLLSWVLVIVLWPR